MIGPIKDYKKYCNFYKFMSLVAILSALFVMYNIAISKDAKLTPVYISQLITLPVGYFSARMMLSICKD